MGEIIAAILTAITTTLINVAEFFATLIQNGNYITIAVIFAVPLAISAAAGASKKRKRTR